MGGGGYGLNIESKIYLASNAIIKICYKLLEILVHVTKFDVKCRYGKSPALYYLYEGDLSHSNFQKLTYLLLC